MKLVKFFSFSHRRMNEAMNERRTNEGGRDERGGRSVRIIVKGW